MIPAKYYYMHWHEDEMLGVAWSPDDPAMDKLLTEPVAIVHWKPIPFTLKDGGFADYQGNSLAVRLCSEKLRGIIENNRAQVDPVQWLPCTVTANGDEERPYFILHTPASYDILDKKQTLFAGGDFVVRACLDVAAVGEHRVFALPGCKVRLMLASVVKQAIESAGCTGLEFSRVLTNG